MVIKIVVGIYDSQDNPDEVYDWHEEVVDNDLINYSRDMKATCRTVAIYAFDKAYIKAYGMEL